MTAAVRRYSCDGYEGSAPELAQRLRPFGITVKVSDEPCVEERQADGRVWREIGDVCAYERGTRMVVWNCRDVTDRDAIVLLRVAERVLMHGYRERGWEQRTTATGRQYAATTVFVPVDEDGLVEEVARGTFGRDGTADLVPLVRPEHERPDLHVVPPPPRHAAVAHHVDPDHAAVAFTACRGWHMANVPPAWAVEMLAELD